MVTSTPRAAQRPAAALRQVSVMPSPSERTAVEFYERLGPAGLAARTRPEWDAEIVSRIREQLRPGARILDLGCGYGRIALPLARSGHAIVGLDLSETLLQEGRRDSQERALPVGWVRATMTSLPIADGCFDVVLCLWTAFFELLERQEQVSALAEVVRVLCPGGWALLEGPVFQEPTESELSSGQRFGPRNRLLRFEVDGAENRLFCHDEWSLRDVAREAGITQPTVYTGPWAGRERLFLRFERHGKGGVSANR